MMPRSALTGSRIRERRLVLGLKQADLAREVEISASYLNLIEHNRRRIGGSLLVRIARVLEVEVSALTQGAETELLNQLGEAAAQSNVAAETDRLDELVGRFPGWAALLVAQQRRIATLDSRVATLLDRLANDPYLSEALHEVLSKVSAVRSTVSILHETKDLDEVWRARFLRNLDADSSKLADGASSLAEYLDKEGDAELSLASPQEELELMLEETGFHIAELEVEQGDNVESIVTGTQVLKSDASRAAALKYLETYRSLATRMPLEDFAQVAREEGFDPGRLAMRFGADLRSVFLRIASLPAETGVGRIGLVHCDGAGALTLRKDTEGFPLPRFGAACPLWPLFQALSRPMTPMRMVLSHASNPGRRFLSFALAQPSGAPGFDGPNVLEAFMLVIPLDLIQSHSELATEQVVGSACRVCPRQACPARREPPVLADGFDSAL